MRHVKLTFGIAGLAATLALAAMQPVYALPVSTGASALKAAVASDVIDVYYWRHRHWRYREYSSEFGYGSLGPPLYTEPPVYYDRYGPPPSSYYEPRYSERRYNDYRPRDYYEPPPFPFFFGPSYPEPYPDPNGPRRQCWVATDNDRGFGYFRPC